METTNVYLGEELLNQIEKVAKEQWLYDGEKKNVSRTIRFLIRLGLLKYEEVEAKNKSK